MMTKRTYKENPRFRPANSVLTFLGETGSGDRIKPPRPANNNEKRSATDGFPIEVEFKEKRLPAYYWDYAKLFADVYERSVAPEAPEYAFFDERDGHGRDDGHAAIQSIAIQARVGTEFFDNCDSYTGKHLIASTLSTDPVTTGYLIPAKGGLVGAEIREDARAICKRVKFRLAHLYQPLIDALVLGKTMKEIGQGFGGNSSNSPAIGREKVLDGLKFAKLVFDALVKEAQKAA